MRYLFAEDEGVLPADDFLEALSSDLEIPLLLNGETSPSYDESPDEIMKNALETQTMQTLEDIDLGFMHMDKNDDFADYFSMSQCSIFIQFSLFS
jgi:hypothetical protein